MREAAFEIARQSDAFAPSLADKLLVALKAPFRRLQDAADLAHIRRTLRVLDDRQLADIGLTRIEVEAIEAATEPARVTLARFKARDRRCAWECEETR